MRFLLLILLISINAFAHEECGQSLHPELADLEALEKALDWHAATDEDVRKAFCTQKSPPTEDQMKDWLNSNQSSPDINKKINGISFENESFENLEAFRLLTTYVDILGNVDPAKHKNFTSQCKKVDCAVAEIFGPQTGTQLLYMQRRYGMNGSHIIKEPTQAAAWRKDELDDVLLALSDFPDGVLPFQEARTMIHAPRGAGNGRTLANAIVTIFDLWNGQTPEQKRTTVTHELGHALSGITSTGKSDDWKKLSGWETLSTVVDGQTVQYADAKKPETIVSEYGQTNAEEDLAEAVVAYRYNPTKLKSASPDKYNMIKATLFDNVEYTSEEACRSPQRTSESLKTKVADKIKSWTPSNEDLKLISNRCSAKAVEDLIEKGFMDLNDNYFRNCYESSVKQQTVEFLKKELKGLPYEAHLEPMIRNAMTEIDPNKLRTIAENAESSHRHAFRNTFTKALNDSHYCRPEFAQYGSQAFDKDTLGFNSYYYRESLNKIMVDACSAKSNKTFQVNQIVR